MGEDKSPILILSLISVKRRRDVTEKKTSQLKGMNCIYTDWIQMKAFLCSQHDPGLLHTFVPRVLVHNSSIAD